MVNHEGHVIVSCATSLDLGVIQPLSELNASIPDCGSLIFSSADHPNKYKYNKNESTLRVSSNVYTRGVQSPAVPNVPETEVNECEPGGTRWNQAAAVSNPSWYSFRWQKMSKSEKCAYAATEGMFERWAVQETSHKVQVQEASNRSYLWW